jgi:hypothetical protein
MDSKEFLNPGRQYRGVALWMLNDELEVGEIARQLDGMADAGWGAVIGRTFNGLRTKYLSEEWMTIIGAIVAGCRRHGMKAWLQAGHMPSAVPDLPREIAHQVLVRQPRAGAPAGETDSSAKAAPWHGAGALAEGETVLAEDDSFAYCQRTLNNVLDLLNEQAVTEYLDDAYEKTWAGRFGKEFGKTIEAVWVDEPHFRPPPLPWSRELPAIFEKKWGYRLTDHLPSLFAPVGDHHKVRHQYWRTVTEMFMGAYFRCVSQWCGQHKLKFAGHLMGEDTLNQQIGWTGATMPAYQHMHLPGIDHLTRSLRWPSGKQFLLTPKQCSSAAHQAGRSEILAEMYGVSSHSISFEDRKRIGDWMAVLGINYRCYHAYFYSMRGRRKRIYVPHLSHQQPWWSENRVLSDYFARVSYALRQGQFAPEVLVMHPIESAYCLYDPTTMDRPHDRTTETVEMKTRDDEMVRLMENLLAIHRSFDLGDETMLAEMGKVSRGMAVPAMCSTGVWPLCTTAVSAVAVSSSVAASEKQRKQKKNTGGTPVLHMGKMPMLRLGKMTYGAVVLPSMITIRRTTLDLLKQFAAAGGKVLAVGDLPSRLDGQVDPSAAEELAKFVTHVANDAEELGPSLAAALPAQIEVAVQSGGRARDVWVHARTVKEGPMFFLVNTNPQQAAQAAVRIRGRGQLQTWDLKTGKIAPLPQRTEGEFVVADLSLAPLGSALLVLNDKARAAVAPAPRREVVREIALPISGTARRHDPNALVLDCCRYRKGQGEWSGPLPVIGVQERLEKEDYRGPLTLQFAFHVEAMPPTIQAAIEDAAQYGIRVNGQGVLPAKPQAGEEGPSHYLDRSFHIVDIAAAVRQGENTLELSVDFRPIPKATFDLASLFEVQTGTELENIYLVGDFAVAGLVSPRAARAKCVRYEPKFSLVPESGQSWGDLTAAGYPFYAGRFTLEDTVELPRPAKGQRVYLELPRLDAALAKVRVNGKEAGAIAWAPYEVEITPLVKAGANRIEIELVGTLRNLMGPHHRSNGEPDDCWRTAFNYTPPEGPAEHAEEAEGAWTDDYFVVHFGLRGQAKIKYVAAR